ncbi:VanZ family protein [Polaribacter sp. R2A056_3_33]|nr:VanZ family protein [Polaribacter sp. HaHaR_3_91]QXP68751.1 VanZ family protein [Polaribacter sp. AHE13PA]QXP72251.1 VanZ family protein [Polaribacter sp. R2A056_3_33]
MLQRIKSLLKDNLFIIAIFITITIAYLSLRRMPKIETGINNVDKIYHLIAYFTLSVTWLFSFYRKPTLKYVIVICCIFFGIIIEVLQQTLTTYRTGDYKDAIANTVGILLGFIIFNQILKKITVNSY